MKTVGWIIFVLASLLGFYALIGFDTSVPIGYGERVNNIGLMQDRQNLLMASCAGAVVGLLMALLSKPGPALSPGGTSFREAIKRNDLDAMQMQIVSGAIDPDGRGPDGDESWLRYAVVEQRPEAVDLLVRMGADPKKPDGYGYSVLEYLTKVGAANKQMSVMREMCSNEELLKEGAASRKVRVDPGQGGKALEINESAAPDDIAARLSQLSQLKAAGALTDEEFAEAKRIALKGS